MFKKCFAKKYLDKELGGIWDDLNDALDTDQCVDMLSDLNDFTDDHGDDELMNQFAIDDLDQEAFGIDDDSDSAHRIKHTVLKMVRRFARQCDINLKSLSNEAQRVFCELLIDGSDMSDAKREQMRDHLNYIDDPTGYMLVKALETLGR